MPARAQTPQSLLILPKEIRLQIFELYIQKPQEIVFDEWRVNDQGFFLCDYDSRVSRYHDLAVKLQSRTISTDLRQWLYSMITFRFSYRPALLQFLRRIGAENRSYLRRITLSLPTVEYFHLFTPERVVHELKLPLRRIDRAFLLPTLSTMHLQCLTVRLHHVVNVSPRATRSYFFGQRQQSKEEEELAPSETTRALTTFYAAATAPDICWVSKSVMATVGTAVPDLRFEAASRPYKRLLPPGVGIELPGPLTWGVLIAAGQDRHDRRTALGSWLAIRNGSSNSFLSNSGTNRICLSSLPPVHTNLEQQAAATMRRPFERLPPSLRLSPPPVDWVIEPPRPTTRVTRFTRKVRKKCLERVKGLNERG